MRVAIDISPAVNRPRAGIGRYVRCLVPRLVEQGAGIRFCLVYGGPADAVPPELRIDGVELLQVSTGVRGMRARWLVSRLALRGVDGSVGAVDLFHGTDGTLPYLERTPAVVTLQDLGFASFPRTVKTANRIYLSQMTGPSLRQAAAVITCSEYIRQEALSRFRLPPDRVIAIPAGAEAFFCPVPPGKEHGHREAGPPFVLAVGTLEPRKNLGTLLDAFALFRQRAPEHRLVIVGQPDFGRRTLIQRIKALGLAGKVDIYSDVTDEDLVHLYRDAAFLVFPSLYEGFGLPPLEAMACGTPVIAARTSSLPEVAGNAALYFEPMNTEELAAKMVFLAASPSRRAEMRHKGLEQAASFSWDRTAELTLQVYRSVAA